MCNLQMGILLERGLNTGRWLNIEKYGMLARVPTGHLITIQRIMLASALMKQVREVT